MISRINWVMSVCLTLGCATDDGDTQTMETPAPAAGQNSGGSMGSGGMRPTGGLATTGGMSSPSGGESLGGQQTGGRASQDNSPTVSGGQETSAGSAQSGGITMNGGTQSVDSMNPMGGISSTGGMSGGMSTPSAGHPMVNHGGAGTDMEADFTPPDPMNGNMFNLELSACSGGICRDGGDADVPVDDVQQQWAQNNGESCTPAAKVNADIVMGRRLSNGRTPNQALSAIENCLQTEDCFRAHTPPRAGDGFGPPPMDRGDKANWDRCFDVLCACNNQIIEGPNVMCEMVYVVPVGGSEPAGGQPAGGQMAGGQPAGGAQAGGSPSTPAPKKTPADCNTPGSVAIFKVPNGSHALTIESYSVLDNGEHQLQVRDPNCPSQGTAPVDVNDEGTVSTSRSPNIPNGSTLLGCFTFR